MLRSQTFAREINYVFRERERVMMQRRGEGVNDDDDDDDGPYALNKSTVRLFSFRSLCCNSN